MRVLRKITEKTTQLKAPSAAGLVGSRAAQPCIPVLCPIRVLYLSVRLASELACGRARSEARQSAENESQRHTPCRKRFAEETQETISALVASTPPHAMQMQERFCGGSTCKQLVHFVGQQTGDHPLALVYPEWDVGLD